MRAKKHRKYHMGLVTRQGAEKSLSEVSEKKFRTHYTVPPTAPVQAVEAKVKMYHNSIFIAGTGGSENWKHLNSGLFEVQFSDHLLFRCPVLITKRARK